MRSILLATLAALFTFQPQAPDGGPLRVSGPATPLQPGSVALLTIDPGGATIVRARAFDRDLAPFRAQPHTWQVLVGIDLAAKPGTYTVAIDTEQPASHTTYPLLVRTHRFPTRTLTVNPNLVNPPASEMERITREARELDRVWNAPAGPRLWEGPFERAVPDPANSSFGTRSVYNGEARSPHSGTDFLSPAGRPIKAPNAGRVVLAASLYFTGGTVVVDHGGGVLSMFAHMSKIDVREGDVLKTGDVIGEVGATGRVTGPHLHWAVHVNGARVDPLSLLAALSRGR
jgi:murein DD-endopeptidase MepM/ murein hydrolase activator NlpD